jgi:hypothetical protein
VLYPQQQISLDRPGLSAMGPLADIAREALAVSVSVANAGLTDSGRQAYPAATLVRDQCNLRDTDGFSASRGVVLPLTILEFLAADARGLVRV